MNQKMTKHTCLALILWMLIVCVLFVATNPIAAYADEGLDGSSIVANQTDSPETALTEGKTLLKEEVVNADDRLPIGGRDFYEELPADITAADSEEPLEDAGNAVEENPDEVLLIDADDVSTLGDLSANSMDTPIEEVAGIESDTDEIVLDDVPAIKAVASTAKASSTSSSTKNTFVIVIDPGHGGYDSGASSYVEEKGVNLAIANYLATELRNYVGVTVYMTRTTDTYVSLSDRVQKAVNWDADLVVSIHNNSGGGSGCEVLVPNSSSWCYNDCYVKGTELGNNVVSELTKLGLSKHGTGLVYRNCTTDDRYPDGSLADYYTLVSGPRENKILGVIIEHAFVDSYSDSRYLIGNLNLQKLAQADAAGIAKTFGLSTVATIVDSHAPVNTEVTFSASKTGKKYNYVWRYGATWDGDPDWGSTVSDTGQYTTATSGSFTPTKTGTYYVWIDIIDAAGKKITSSDGIVSVWDLKSVTVKSSAVVGSKSAITTKVAGGTSGLTFNYSWSTSDSSGSSGYQSSANGSFTPSKTGEYNVWVTVKDASGHTLSSAKKSVSVWSLSLDIDKTAAMTGDTVTMTPVVTGNVSGLKYNYVWRLGQTWETWDSTVKSTGNQTTATSGQVKMALKGTYYLWMDATDSNGVKATSEAKTCIAMTNWTFGGTNAEGPYYLLIPVSYSADVSGETADLSYNYVWRYGTNWNDWGSSVKSTGKMTKTTSGSFTPTKAGTYYAWVDVQDANGNKGTTSAITIPISEYKVKVTSSAKTGDEVSFSLESAPSSGLTYNYIWRYGTNWSSGDWDSTVKSTGKMTTEKSSSFTVKHPGTYQVWIDVKSSSNQAVSTTVPIKVTLSWNASSTEAPSNVTVNDVVNYSAKVSGNTSGLTYNYVWRYGTSWGSDWGSSVKSNGKMVSSKSSSFTAKKLGTYEVWVDVQDEYGNKVTTKTATVASGYAIMGSPSVTAAQMASYYNSIGVAYPSSTYSSKGAKTINDFAAIVLEEANAEGVKAEVLFAQVMLETGNLQFGGDVKKEQCNFGGLGATGNGNPGLTFSNVRQGLRAQAQHLKAYASTEPLNNTCVDPRFDLVSRGSAKYVEQLSGKWATGSDYGTNIVAIINRIKKQ